MLYKRYRPNEYIQNPDERGQFDGQRANEAVDEQAFLRVLRFLFDCESELTVFERTCGTQTLIKLSMAFDFVKNPDRVTSTTFRRNFNSIVVFES